MGGGKVRGRSVVALAEKTAGTEGNTKEREKLKSFKKKGSLQTSCTGKVPRKSTGEQKKKRGGCGCLGPCIGGVNGKKKKQKGGQGSGLRKIMGKKKKGGSEKKGGEVREE